MKTAVSQFNVAGQIHRTKVRVAALASPTKGARIDWSRGVVHGVRPSAVGAQPRSERNRQTASLFERLSASKFPFRHPILHGLLFELRSFRHRIQLLWQRGGTRLLETGSVYQQTGPPSCLVLNRQTQLRTQGIQRLLSECPWLSGEDCYLFLMGWNRGWESCEGLDTAKSSGDMRDSFALHGRGNVTPPQAVQQSTKHDPSNPFPPRDSGSEDVI
jgi:hypothetical protein